MLADTRLFQPTPANVEGYIDEIGSVDEHLAGLLEAFGPDAIRDAVRADDSEASDPSSVAISLLNASEIPSTSLRVALAQIFCLDPPLDVDRIEPESGAMLASLLSAGLVRDDASSFMRFRDQGWDTIGPAIIQSGKIAQFSSPELLDGMIKDVLTNSKTAAKLGRLILEDINEYVSDEDSATIAAAARFADSERIRLDISTISILARSGRTKEVLRLLKLASPSAEQVAAVFKSLGRPYSRIAENGAEFHVPNDSLHLDLLTILSDAKVCTFRKRRMREEYVVDVNGGVN